MMDDKQKYPILQQGSWNKPDKEVSQNATVLYVSEVISKDSFKGKVIEFRLALLGGQHDGSLIGLLRIPEHSIEAEVWGVGRGSIAQFRSRLEGNLPRMAEQVLKDRGL